MLGQLHQVDGAPLGAANFAQQVAKRSVNWSEHSELRLVHAHDLLDSARLAQCGELRARAIFKFVRLFLIGFYPIYFNFQFALPSGR